MLRPRQPWEAVDLGVALLRAHAGPVYRAWWAVVLPLFALLQLLCFAVPWLVPWILWWLKPLLDRVVLYVLSRALFGEVVTVSQVLRALPSEWWRDGLMALTLRRLSPMRSFVLAVSQLEGQRGKERAARLRTLAKRDGGQAMMLTLVCLNLEIVVALGLMGLVAMFLPEFMLENLLDSLREAPHAVQFLLSLAVLGAMSVMEPCYVACGFALYLNRRTWLEAWDLEIGFRRLARRLGGVALVVLLLTPFSPGVQAQAPDSAEAEVSAACRDWEARREALAHEQGEVKAALARTLEEAPFQRCRLVSHWGFDQESDSLPQGPTWTLPLAGIVEGTLWLLLGVGVVLLVVWLSRQQRPAGPAKRARTRGASLVLHGETIHAEGLDPGSSQEAWRLWQSGHQRDALALLYRASLAALLARGVNLGRASTEEECLDRAATQLSAPAHAYLVSLTRTWQGLAYAHRLPESTLVARLCGDWAASLLSDGDHGDTTGKEEA